jgi:hypothetical protein
VNYLKCVLRDAMRRKKRGTRREQLAAKSKLRHWLDPELLCNAREKTS